MTVKEIFEIEPIQKNSILVITFVCFISFLQLYLFKNNFVKESDFVKVILSVSVSICWLIAEIPTYLFAFPILIKPDENIKQKQITEFLIIALGFTLVFWMILLTYIGYEFNLSIKDFIRLCLIWMTGKGIYWFIRSKVHNAKLKA
jgi:hypothetical protein